MNTPPMKDPNDDPSIEQREVLKRARATLCALVDQGTLAFHPMSEMYEKVNDIIGEIEEILGY